MNYNQKLKHNEDFLYLEDIGDMDNNALHLIIYANQTNHGVFTQLFCCTCVHGKHSFLDQCFIIYVQLSLFFFLLITEKNNQNTFQQQEIVKKNSVCMCVHFY